VLDVARPNDPRSLDLDVAPLEQIAADLIQLRIPPESRLHGVEVSELRLPMGSSVSLLIRDGRTMVPDDTAVLRARDVVLVVVPRHQRELAERRLEMVSRKGRLAGWLR